MSVEAGKPENSRLRILVKRWTVVHLLLLATAYLALVVLTFPGIDRLLEAWIFFPVGIFGAIVANSTGTGGGVVFVPAFSELNIAPPQSIGMSFLIQSFGMSIGALVWLNAFYGNNNKKPSSERLDAHTAFGIITIVLVSCLPSLLLTQWLFFSTADQGTLLFAFKVFSIVLGSVLLVFTLAINPLAPKKLRKETNTFDNLMLFLIGVVGGAITALFSVGVGEFLAIYLIFRHFPTVSAIVCAVVVSIVSVFTGVWYHLINNTLATRVIQTAGDSGSQIFQASERWEVVILAIPGALLGGYMASFFARFLGTQKLKIFASLWIILSALYLLFQGAVVM